MRLRIIVRSGAKNAVNLSNDRFDIVSSAQGDRRSRFTPNSAECEGDHAARRPLIVKACSRLMNCYLNRHGMITSYRYWLRNNVFFCHKSLR